MKAKADSGQKHLRENTPGSSSGTKHNRDQGPASALWRMWYKPVAFWNEVQTWVCTECFLSGKFRTTQSVCAQTFVLEKVVQCSYLYLKYSFAVLSLQIFKLGVRGLRAGCHMWVGMREHNSPKRRVDCGTSALQLGKGSQTVVQTTISQRWYLCQLCLGPVSTAVRPQSVILDTVSLSAHSGSGVWVFTKFLVWGQSFLVPISLGARGRMLCPGVLVICSCHLEGCISCIVKDLLERMKWILPFNAVTEQIVCERVCLCTYFLIHFC